MNRNQLAGRLQQCIGIIKEYWGNVADAASLAERGRRARISGRIRAERALAAEQADRQLREFLQRHRHWKITA